MKRLEHKIDGEVRVHYEGPFSNGLALCGQDIEGDIVGAEYWDEAKPTTHRVNCLHCLAIVAHVRGRSKTRVKTSEGDDDETIGS